MEVELLQVMAAASGRVRGVGAAAEAWRLEVSPALDREGRWMAFDGRPDGKRRQVLVSYLGDWGRGPGPRWLAQMT